MSSFWHWYVKGFSSKRTALKVDVLQDRKIHCRRVRASFSPEILQAGAVKELIQLMSLRLVEVENAKQYSTTFCFFAKFQPVSLYPMYVASNKCDIVNWRMVVWCTLNVHRDDRSFTRHQPFKKQHFKYTAFVDIQLTITTTTTTTNTTNKQTNKPQNKKKERSKHGA